MNGAVLKKMACIGLLAALAVVSGCGSEHKAAVIDLQKIETESTKIQSIQKEVISKDKEISERMNQAAESGLSEEEMQQKVQAARQERMIFLQSKQKEIESLVQSTAGAVAKEKDIGIVMQKRAAPAGAVDITDEVLKKIDGNGAGSSASAGK